MSENRSILLKNVKKQYNGRTILDIEDLSFEKGKIYAILGLNGSGKTTLLRILAGLERQDSGDVRCEGSIAFLAQEIYLFDMTVASNMKTAIGKTEASLAVIKDAIEKVNMTDFYHKRTQSMSGGEKQRIAIARTLAQKREIVLLDEPTAYVDMASTALVENYMKEMQRETQATMLFTTHNPSQALRIANEVVILWDGIPIEQGPSGQVLHHPEHEMTRRFLSDWRLD